MSSLNEKAAAIMYPRAKKVLQDDGGVCIGKGEGVVVWYFDRDLNDTVELWRAASEEVREKVLFDINEHDLRAFVGMGGESRSQRVLNTPWLDPARLTAAIVEAWEVCDGSA